ncbi:MAG TPA: hypothetical protein VGH86_02315 [Phenylobacterium sp.]|jgi:starvation-inducible outer membrane lipoprotein
MRRLTGARLGLAILTSVLLLAACAGVPAPVGGYGNPTPSVEGPDH